MSIVYSKYFLLSLPEKVTSSNQWHLRVNEMWLNGKSLFIFKSNRTIKNRALEIMRNVTMLVRVSSE